MSDIKRFSDLWNVLEDPESEISTAKETVFSISKSYLFATVLHNIAEDVTTTCQCRPSCRIDLVSAFLRLCPNDYSLTSGLKESDTEKADAYHEEEYFKDLLRIESHADIKEFVDREFYDYTGEDFPKAAVRATAVFKFFTVFFRRSSPKDFSSPKLFLDLTARLVAKAGAHATTHETNPPWTNDSSVRAANDLLQSLLLCCSRNSLSELLVWSPFSSETEFLESFRYADSIFGKVLSSNQSRLIKDKWPKNPHVKSTFCWCLMQVKYPYLSFYLDQILPHVLLFVDDFITEHKMTGLKCLAHIIANVSKEELRWYNRHAVIFDALKHQLYTQEQDVLRNVLLSLLSILSVIEENPRSSQNTDYNHYDEIFELILYNAEMENNLAFRRIYTSFIPTLIETMGITCVRHMKALLRVIETYLEIHDGPHETARLNILCSLQKILEVAWPRVVPHLDFLVKVLLKLLYDVSVEDVMITSEPAKKKLVDKITELLCTLKKLNAQRIEELLTAVSGDVIDVADFQFVVESVITTKV